jgi:hypothetical protein
MASEAWTAAAHAHRHLTIAGRVPHRAEDAGVLPEQVPRDARRIADPGTGDACANRGE